jgi:hypothetical protein
LAIFSGAEVGVIVGVGTIGVIVEVGVDVSVGTTITAGTHETKIMETSKLVTIFLIFIVHLILQGTAQRQALPACGRAWTQLERSINPKPEKCS